MEKRFQTTDLVGQFIVCKSPEYVPEGWPVRRHGPWLLATHPVLPAAGIQAADGSNLGWLIGYPISKTGILTTSDTELALDPAGDDLFGSFEKLLYEFGGRFACVVFDGSDARAYLDPGGSLSAVYSPAHEIVCSTPPLIPYSKGCDDDRNLIDIMQIPERNSIYPFGLTPRRGVERIPPNFFLDLSSWETTRHWPADGLDTDDDVETSVGRIADVTKRQIAAVARDHELHMSLTAGRDSRLLLACSREHIEKVSLFTFCLDESAETDRRAAQLLTRRLGIGLSVLEFEEPSEDDLMLWLYRTGCCVGEKRGWRVVRTYRALDPARAELPGVCGEAGRLSYWHKWETESSDVNMEEFLGRVGVPITPEIMRRAQGWLDGLPVTNTLRILDMMLIELFLGGWAGLLPYADPVSTAFRVYPLCHRETLERLMRLPTPYRRSQSLTADVCKREWPELLTVPFNEPVGHKRLLAAAGKNVHRAKKALTRPGLFLRKIKNRLEH